MSELTTLKLKTKTGNVQEIQVLEILEINGKRYQPPEENEGLREHIIHLDGRLSAIEKILSNGN